MKKCESGWIQNGENCYFYEGEVNTPQSSSRSMTWADAIHRCKSLHSELLSIDNEQEAQFITDFTPNYMTPNFWAVNNHRYLYSRTPETEHFSSRRWSTGKMLQDYTFLKRTPASEDPGMFCGVLETISSTKMKVLAGLHCKCSEQLALICKTPLCPDSANPEEYKFLGLFATEDVDWPLLMTIFPFIFVSLALLVFLVLGFFFFWFRRYQGFRRLQQHRRAAAIEEPLNATIEFQLPDRSHRPDSDIL